MNNEFFALVTGAGQGIGLAFAEEAARRGINIIMVSLPGEGLTEKAIALEKKYGIKAFSFETDLTQPGACSGIFDFVKEKAIPLNILINNAGIGSNGTFESFSPEFYQKQIQLNISVPVTLIRIFIPILELQEQSYILNMSSLGAFFNMPQKEVYNATKSFLYSFSRSLRIHLQGSNISLSVVCPGPVDSNARLLEIHENLKGLAKKAVMKPGEVARIGLDGLFAKKAVVIPGRLNRLMLTLNSWIPATFKNAFMRKEMERQASLNIGKGRKD